MTYLAINVAEGYPAFENSSKETGAP